MRSPPDLQNVKKWAAKSRTSITNASKATTNGNGTNNTETATRAVAIQVRPNAKQNYVLPREAHAARPPPPAVRLVRSQMRQAVALPVRLANIPTNKALLLVKVVLLVRWEPPQRQRRVPIVLRGNMDLPVGRRRVLIVLLASQPALLKQFIAPHVLSTNTKTKVVKPNARVARRVKLLRPVNPLVKRQRHPPPPPTVQLVKLKIL